MKLNIAFPAPDCQSLTEVDNEYKLILNKLRAAEVAAGALGEKVTLLKSVVGAKITVSPGRNVN